MSTDFWTSSSQYGLVHKAADPPANPEALVVFVHGLFGNCRRTWGRMPQWVLEAAGLDLDVVSFSYPSRPWERAAIPQAADDLKTWLDTELQAYRHLVFVTHSSGGLVVKDLLRGAVRDGHAAVPGSDPGAPRSVWLRTRRIINIAVPHQGGAPFMTWFGKASYLALYPLMAPILSSVRFVTQGRMDWGRNEIIPALRWQSPWLLRLEREFLEAIEGARVRDLPASVVHGIFAKSDLSVPVQVLDQDRRVGSERPPRPGALGKQPALTWSRSCADRSPRPSGPSPPVDAGWRM